MQNDWPEQRQHAVEDKWDYRDGCYTVTVRMRLAPMNDLDRITQHPQTKAQLVGVLEKQRAAAIARLLDGGWTYRSLAVELGVSHTLIHQWRWPNGKPEE